MIAAIYARTTEGRRSRHRACYSEEAGHHAGGGGGEPEVHGGLCGERHPCRARTPA